MAQTPHVEPFTISVSDAQIADLRRRLADTRWPDQLPGTGWDYGCDLAWLRDLASYWADGFDWRSAEARLNSMDQVVSASTPSTSGPRSPMRYRCSSATAGPARWWSSSG